MDFDRVFSSVVKPTTIRLALIVAAAQDYNIHQIDIRQAYLQAELKEELFMRVPPGVPAFDRQGRPLVCKLNRSLYGCKQSGRLWSETFKEFLVDWGFKQSSIDVCFYTYTETCTHGTHLIWACVYVDNVCLVDNHDPLRERFMTAVSKRFPVDDRGVLEWMLGVAVSRDRAARTLTLSQELYVKDTVEKYASFIGAGHTRSFDSPMEEGLMLSRDDSPEPNSDEWERMADRRAAYMAIVGSLLWLANMTRPELSYASSQLARFVSNPGEVHFNAALRVLIYLDGSHARTLTYRPDADRGLDVYVDSSWLPRFSCSGALYFFHGCLFHWVAKMQRSVSLSSAEAEYFGAMLAATEVVWRRDLLFDLSLLRPGPTVLLSDSKSAVDLAFDPIAFKNTKHILRAAEYLRDLVARGVVTLAHVKGTLMLADLLTKAQARPIFLELMRLLDEYTVPPEPQPSESSDTEGPPSLHSSSDNEGPLPPPSSSPPSPQPSPPMSPRPSPPMSPSPPHCPECDVDLGGPYPRFTELYRRHASEVAAMILAGIGAAPSVPSGTLPPSPCHSRPLSPSPAVSDTTSPPSSPEPSRSPSPEPLSPPSECRCMCHDGPGGHRCCPFCCSCCPDTEVPDAVCACCPTSGLCSVPRLRGLTLHDAQMRARRST